ncbi:UDP-glucose/GDP-mannose dehydrogenase family protein [Candidatus Woesebacteria bacterium]|nr:UDP-glucose/GDP-mannose dehydrogenase family protein [Candidatus Woesebacteria bacterium]
MKITIIGTGFVGVVSAAVYATFGHEVVGLDIDESKINSLRASKVPFFEPDLENLLATTQKKGNLTFTTSYAEAITNSDVVIVAVGTPSGSDGNADLKYVFMSSESMAPYLKENAIVVIKSTVPPGTLAKVEDLLNKTVKVKYFTASVPEFLKEGTAVYDTLNPDRIVIGAKDAHAFNILEDLHKPFKAPIIKISPESAQMAKYSANAYLATRITFINQISDLCEKNGADILEIIQAIGVDKRIGKHYWYPGFGYGGSCFPKDVKELAHYSRTVGEEGNLFNKISDINEERIEKLLVNYSKKIGGFNQKKVAVLGLSFKPNTDDMREAPSIKVINYLIENGSIVSGFDPKALSVVNSFIKPNEKITYHDNINEAAKGADIVIGLIEWSEIINFDFSQVRDDSKVQWFIDARNQFSRSKIEGWGFSYIGVGR